ncbi:MAG: ParB/RepB/Spo0J family partition protein [Pseudomonadota bacterium]
MAAPDKRLGRGLDALFRHTSEPAKAEEVTKLALRVMFPNPDQPRKIFSDEALTELAASIKEHGVLQPILVRPMPQDQEAQLTSQSPYAGQVRYQIIAGERRWKASQLAGLVEVPVVVRHFTDQETLAVALIENLQREDLNPMEEAQALHHLRETFKLSQEDLARQLSKSRSAIANILRLLQLPESMHADVASGTLTAGHARALLAITDAEVQAALHARMLEQAFTVRDAEDAVSHWKEKGFLPICDVPQAQDSIVGETSCAPCAPTTAEVPDNTHNAAQAHDGAPSAQAPLAQQRSTRRKAPAVKLLQKRLTEHLALKTSISGTESKGKITLSYANIEELQRLITILGLEQSQDQSPSQAQQV